MATFFCNYRPQKDVPHWTRLMEGVNLISFIGGVIKIIVDIRTENFLSNITISTKGARLLLCDIKNFYLGTTIDRY